jgi:hypothetical protein
MGYQPPRKSPKGAIRTYRKPLHEKTKNKRQVRRPTREQQHPTTEKEVLEATLRRLHVLGSQKFGSSPFSAHFDRWLSNVESVINEFKSHYSTSVDDQFIDECSQTLATIKQQLEERHRRETVLDKEIGKLTDSRERLAKISKEYVAMTGALRRLKNREAKRLYKIIDDLKSEQERVIQMKTGFFHGISMKQREQKEMEVTQQLAEKQRELELFILDCNAKLKLLREEYEKKREPVLEQIKIFQKSIRNMETDASLEERWFACKALVDSVNNFLQRKAAKTSS